MFQKYNEGYLWQVTAHHWPMSSPFCKSVQIDKPAKPK